MHTVLVVDNDAAVRRTITRFLALEGFAAIEAGNGHAALSYLRSGGEASLILLELPMPIMDGWAFRREQRADPALARIPVIVLSSADVDRYHEVEAVAAFHKPASMAALLGCVRRHCGRSTRDEPAVGASFVDVSRPAVSHQPIGKRHDSCTGFSSR